MALHDDVVDLHAAVLSSTDGGDAVRRASILAERALNAAIAPGKPPAGLGEKIGLASRTAEVRDKLGAALLTDLNWLNKRRIEAVHEPPLPISVDDGAKTADIACAALTRVGLLDDDGLARALREAQVKASVPAESSVLKLDRAAQRAALDDILLLPLRMCVVVVDGEAGQGHDHFAQVVQWRLRAIPKGRWRDLTVQWPAPSASTGTRFAQLVDNLAEALGVPAAATKWPDVDPIGDGAGAAAWDAAMAPLFDAVAKTRSRLWLRHAIGWPADNDLDLVDAYLRRVWSKAAPKTTERVLLALELQRAQPSPVPLTKGWFIGRAERKVVKEMVTKVENLELPAECRTLALAELTSVSKDDLATWFRNENNRPKAAADVDAQTVLAATQNGRFELVVKRIGSHAIRGTR